MVGRIKGEYQCGEQYPSGTDDYVQSEIWLSSDLINHSFLEYLKYEMTQRRLCKNSFGVQFCVISVSYQVLINQRQERLNPLW